MATTTIPTSPFIFSLFFLSLFILTSSLHEPDILLTFKASIEDSNNSLSTWSNTSSTHFCNWVGITCSTTTPPSIISLNLQNLNLSGEISSSICQLPNLSQLNLANNIFNQPIPLHLSQCTSLQTLNLSNNLIWGTIPDQVSLFSSLKVLDLKNNHIEGKIPENLGSLKNLQVLNLGSNLFAGSPSFFLVGVNINQFVQSPKVEQKFKFSPVGVNFLTEAAKVLFAIVMLLFQSRRQKVGEKPIRSVSTFMQAARNNVFLAVPALLYAINNYLKFNMQVMRHSYDARHEQQKEVNDCADCQARNGYQSSSTETRN